MKKLIRYFTLRKRLKQMIIDTVKQECKWHTEYIKRYNDENFKTYCDNRLNELKFLKSKLQELL